MPLLNPWTKCPQCGTRIQLEELAEPPEQCPVCAARLTIAPTKELLAWGEIRQRGFFVYAARHVLILAVIGLLAIGVVTWIRGGFDLSSSVVLMLLQFVGALVHSSTHWREAEREYERYLQELATGSTDS